MHLKNVVIENYKSFLGPQTIEFSPGFNVLVGANNAGKTALLELISLKFENRAHRSLETIPQKGGISNLGTSSVQINWTISTQQLRQLLSNISPTFYIQKGREESPEEITRRVMDAFALEEVNIRCKYKPDSIVFAKIEEMDSNHFQDLGLQLQIKDPSSSPIRTGHNVSVRSVQDFAAYKLAITLSSRIFFFRAERFNVGQYQISNDQNLKSDASNLAQVLNLLLTSNKARFERLVSLIKVIFPDVRDITIPPTGNSNEVKVHLWYIDSSTEREDLALPLQESGNAIGQVLSILYVAIISDFPQLIIIDEPQSFLHPAAIRKLFEILHLHFSKHQYIITTHSPLVVSAANPENIILLKKEGMVTQTKSIQLSEKEEIQSLLLEVGARFSDVFGSENILWVEGATEENTFPLIVSKILHAHLMGTAIIGIINVGDFESKYKDLVLRIYKKLSTGSTLIPPAIGFILDKEERSKDEQHDLEHESGGLIHFLHRRMYENYLINPEAIASVISKLENFSDKDINKEDIEKWLDKNQRDPKYVKDRFSQKTETWLANVHGAKLLNDLFNALSENRYSYDKVRHGIKLTSWIIDNKPEELKEISDLLSSILDSNKE